MYKTLLLHLTELIDFQTEKIRYKIKFKERSLYDWMSMKYIPSICRYSIFMNLYSWLGLPCIQKVKPAFTNCVNSNNFCKNYNSLLILSSYSRSIWLCTPSIRYNSTWRKHHITSFTFIISQLNPTKMWYFENENITTFFSRNKQFYGRNG